jgi:hypothetical protein
VAQEKIAALVESAMKVGKRTVERFFAEVDENVATKDHLVGRPRQLQARHGQVGFEEAGSLAMLGAQTKAVTLRAKVRSPLRLVAGPQRAHLVQALVRLSDALRVQIASVDLPG